MADTRKPVPFLAYARQIALHHHEQWNGSGYPDALVGEAIPLAARLMAVAVAVAGVFDAMISRCVCKQPTPMEEVRTMMTTGRGKHFDPDLLDAFVEGMAEFCGIAWEHLDEPITVVNGA